MVYSISDKTLKAEVIAHLGCSASELETGWNLIRLGNVPVSLRQGRVATEFVAGAVLLSMPNTSNGIYLRKPNNIFFLFDYNTLQLLLVTTGKPYIDIKNKQNRPD